jgi:hypothetical protein
MSNLPFRSGFAAGFEGESYNFGERAGAMSEVCGTGLASHRRCVERIRAGWPGFLTTRADRLRHGDETEKVAEGIIEDLLTNVLDWRKGDLLYQTGYADIVVSRNLAKYLLIEMKRPGTLQPGRKALELAVAQARRYADAQRVTRVAASDGRWFYAADIAQGGLKDRLLLDLSVAEPPDALWWISEHGIYRACDVPVLASDVSADAVPALSHGADELLHPKYKVPARCFAYVGNAADPRTWKLPYRLADGCVDAKRLPKAIQSLLSNYRGVKVNGIPECDMPGVLLRLARAAETEGHLPPRAVNPASAYRDLALVLEQQGLMEQLRA